MDFTILIIVGIVIGVLGLSALITYLSHRGYINEKSLLIVMEMFDLTVGIVKELNLKQEKQIEVIANVVDVSLDFAIRHFDNNIDRQIEAYNYAVKLFNQLDIELTESRQVIIRQLIMIGLGNYYVKN